jgi:hypothetical protein
MREKMGRVKIEQQSCRKKQQQQQQQIHFFVRNPIKTEKS